MIQEPLDTKLCDSKIDRYSLLTFDSFISLLYGGSEKFEDDLDSSSRNLINYSALTRVEEENVNK